MRTRCSSSRNASMVPSVISTSMRASRLVGVVIAARTRKETLHALSEAVTC